MYVLRDKAETRECRSDLNANKICSYKRSEGRRGKKKGFSNPRFVLAV